MKNSLAAPWLFGLCLCGLLLPAFGQEKTVSVYGWGDYIDPKVIEDFTKETGIKVTYDAYDSNEAFEGRFLSGKAGFDVLEVHGAQVGFQVSIGLGGMTIGMR